MQWFYNLKIMPRLLAGFVLVALLTAVVGYIGITNIRAMDESSTTLYEINTVPISLLQDITESFQRARYNVLELALADTPERRAEVMKKLADRRNEIEKASQELEKRNVAPEMKQAFSEFLLQRKNFVTVVQDPVAALSAAGRNAEALQLINGDGEKARMSYQDSIEKMVDIKVAAAKKRSEDNTAQAGAASRNMLIVIGIAFALAIFLGWFIARSVSRPVGKMVAAAERLAVGDVTVAVEAKTRDEIGELARALQAMIANIRAAADASEKIAKGDLTVRVIEQSDKDVLSKSLNLCIDNIKALVADAERLAQAAVEGRLDTRADASMHQGDYRKIVEGVNHTLDALVGPINVTAEYVDRISKGDIPPKITDVYNGDFNEIKNNLNNCIDVMSGLLKETEGLIQATKDGQLDRRGNEAAFAGGWGQLVGGVNQLINAFVGPINVTAEYVDRISKG
ncbi:MAG: MCP four helix bundle domain-containing protein, partial [Negativicutes bacterium]|nr:MCP four helix bundle domain-containing protein [Negativicutes bacterium]